MTEPAHVTATRAAYDDVAVLYAERFRTALQDRPLDRALLSVFAELVRANGDGPVADLGCGPGHMTAHLRSLGVQAFGVDLSPAMVTLARQDHPELRFDEGSMTALDLADGALHGILAWYSVIHTPPELLPAVFAEFHRLLAPGGHLLLGFFADSDQEQPAEPFDHKVTTAYRWSPDALAGILLRSGLVEVARLLRQPQEGERFLQAALLVRRAGDGHSAGAVRGTVTGDGHG